MASLNPLTRELVFKIVFYGPGLGGKTTTLQHIHTATKPELRGKMVSLATPMDRTLYFDFLPLRVPRVRGMGIRLQLFTVPGQVYYGATRKLVLTGADGVVFVADSQPGRMEANQESLEDLVANLVEHNRPLSQVSHTFHWNKRDLADAVPPDELDRKFNLLGAPSIGTVATSGEGVFDGLESITRLVLQAYEAELPRGERSLETRFDPSDEGGIADAIRGLAESPDRRAVTPLQPVPPPHEAAAQRAVAQIALPRPTPIPPGPDDEEAVELARTQRIEPPDGLGTPAPPKILPTHAVEEAVARATPHPAEEDSEVSDLTPSGGVEAVGGPAPDEERREPGEPRAPSAPPARPDSGAPDGFPLGDDVEEMPTVNLAGDPLPAFFGRRAPSAFTLADLWAEGERDTAREAEQAIASRDLARAVMVCDTLVTRVLASAAGLLGTADAPRDPGSVALLLGLDGRRYLRFRAVVRAVRQSEEIQSRDALECYGFALEVRRARESIGR